MAAVACAAILADAARGTQLPPPDTPDSHKSDTSPFHCLVVDRAGKPVSGVAVQAWGPSNEPGSSTTDTTGRTIVPRDPSADIMPLLARRGEELAWGRFSASGPIGKGGSGKPSDPIVLTLLPRNHKISGVVVDNAGQPLVGVTVYVASLWHQDKEQSFYVDRAQLEANGWPLGSALSDAGGRYSLSLPDQTIASLATRHPRYVGPTLSVPVESVSVEPFELEPAGAIIGTVKDSSTGAPIAGASVGAQLLEHRVRLLGGAWGDGFTDAQGQLRIEGLEAGVYNLLLLSVPGRAQATARAVEGVRVRAGEDARADLNVFDGRPLRGVVIDAKTHHPAAGVPVGCYGPARPRSGAAVASRRTDDLGRFTFYLPPGEQYLYLMDGRSQSRLSRRYVTVPEKGVLDRVRLIQAIPKNAGPFPPGFAQAEVKATTKYERKKTEAVKAVPAAPRPAPPRPKVPQGRTLTGQVMDRQGLPVPGVQVQAIPVVPGGVPQAFQVVVTDREGIFLLPGLPRSPVHLRYGRSDQYLTKSIEADQDVVELEYEPPPDPRALNEPGPARDDPIPAELKDRLTFVSLEEDGNEFVVDGPGGSGNDLARLPRGVHKLGDTFYRVGDWIVHLRGQNARDLPKSISGIAVGARADTIHFVHAVQQADPPGTEVGAYVVHYAEGTSERIPIVYGRDIANWWQFPQAQPDLPTQVTVAWSGSNDATDMNPGIRLRLFTMTWTNPHPDRVIRKVDVESKVAASDLFVVAVTSERKP